METFICSCVTKDGFKTAVGGLCTNNYASICSESYKAFEHVEFGEKMSGFYVDFMLGKKLKEFSMFHVKGVCASIKAGKTGKCFGGAAGSPFKDIESADGSLEQIDDNIYTIAVPGRMGTVFESGYSTAKEIHEYFIQLNKLNIKEAIERAVLFMENKGVIFAASTDGSGEGSYGAVYTSGQKWCYL